MSTHRSRSAVPGIYTVTNTVDCRVYVGRSVDVQARWANHRTALKGGIHRNRRLQHAWTKHGALAFEFAMWADLSDVPEAELSNQLHAAEYAALAMFPRNYNLADVGPTHVKQAPETKALIRERMLEIWKTRDREAPGLRMALYLAERWADPAERAAQAARTAALNADPAFRGKVDDASRASWADPEKRAARHAAILEANATPEAFAARSAAQLETWQDPEVAARRIAKSKAARADPVVKASTGKVQAATWADPEIRARRIAALRAASATPETKARRAAANRRRAEARRAAKAATPSGASEKAPETGVTVPCGEGRLA